MQLPQIFKLLPCSWVFELATRGWSKSDPLNQHVKIVTSHHQYWQRCNCVDSDTWWPYQSPMCRFQVQWAGRCILTVRYVIKKVPERAFSCNQSWSLSFICEYFHVRVKRQMISFLHEEVIVMSSFRMCYTTFDKENKLTNMCLCFTKDMCHCCDYGNLSVQSCACDVTHVVAMQPAGNTCGC